VLGWEVVERQQLLLIVGDLLDRLGELRAVELHEHQSDAQHRDT
jgi:hypothetical protein